MTSMTSLLLALSLLGALQEKKLSVPDAATQKQAEKLLREVFKEEYGKKAVADRVALARTLLQKGLEKDEEDASRYVLLREAKDLASQAGDWELSFKAVDALGQWFELDGVALKEATLAAWTKAATTVAEMLKVARTSLAFAEDATKIGRMDAAERAITQAGSLARKAKDLNLAAKADALGKDLAEKKAQTERLARARETLAAKPEDPEANLLLGRQECFDAGDWEAGLAKLAKCSDAALKALAQRELASPSTAADCTGLADGWWDLAEKQPAPVRLKMRDRARHWYELAGNGLSGLTKTKVAQRLSDLRADRFPGVWIDVTDGKLFGRTERKGEPIVLVPDEGKGRRTLFNEPPPGEYDGLSVRMKLPSDWTGRSYVMFENYTACLAIHRPNHCIVLCTRPKEEGVWNVKKQIECPDAHEFVVTVMLHDGNYWFYLDGNEVGAIPATQERIRFFALSCDFVPVTFDQIKLHRKE